MAKTALGREPFVCRDIRVATQRLGSTYGGWHVVPDGITPESVVYSFGIGEDISFDTAFIATYGTTVHAFDPTPKLLRGYEVKTCQRDWSFTTTVSQPLMVRSHFLQPENDAHVSHTVLDRPATKGRAIHVPVKRIRTIMSDLGHTSLDILKMDIEGAEYDVIDDMLASGILPRQVLIEFHHRFPNVGLAKTTAAIQKLRSAGYALCSVSSSNEEYGFLRSC
jgi:FkbM family methyltransferase